MSPFLLSLASTPSKATSDHVVFTNWLKAIIAFQQSYKQLNQCILSATNNPSLDHFVGQCTTHQVDQLVVKMGDELALLVTELENPFTLLDLIDHTTRLNQLTNQAAVVISLAKLSSC